MAKRLRSKLADVKRVLMRSRHAPIPVIRAWLRRVVQGYFNYHAIPGNMARLDAFRSQTFRLWLRALRRRSQKNRMTWERLVSTADRWIPRPQVLHLYPNVRFYAKHPR